MCADDSCVLGIVGRPMSLPCVLPELVNSENVTIEWMRDSELVLRSVWKPDGSVETWSNNRVAVPADAPLTGNVSLNLPAVRPVEDQMSYSLFMVLGKNQSARLCTTCLRTAGKSRGIQGEAEEGYLEVQSLVVGGSHGCKFCRNEDTLKAVNFKHETLIFCILGIF